MRTRAPRFKTHTAALPAVLAGRPLTVLDISVTGSLGLIGTELLLGSKHTFRLGNEADAIRRSAYVVRVTASGEPASWKTAVAFVETTRHERYQIGALLVRLLRERSG